MGMTVGPTSWWARSNLSTNYFARICPVGTTLPDGSSIFCKEGGRSWIVSPYSTEVFSTWTSGKCPLGTDIPPFGVGPDVCCICDWSTLCTALINNGFNPCDWFVPNSSQLTSGFNCRSYLGGCCCNNEYFSSTEVSSNNAYAVRPSFGSPTCVSSLQKDCCCFRVRAFRCVTY